MSPSFFSSLFSSSEKQSPIQKRVQTPTVMDRAKNFAGRALSIMGLTMVAGNSVALAPLESDKFGFVPNGTLSEGIQSKQTVDITRIVSAALLREGTHFARVQPGESASGFVLRNFGAGYNWRELMSEDGVRINHDGTNLIAGKSYTLRKFDGSNEVVTDITTGNNEVESNDSSGVNQTLSSTPAQKPRFAMAQYGDSVHGFMLRNFGTIEGWELLVEKEQGGRVINPATDLLAGKYYILAADETKAKGLSNIFKQQYAKKTGKEQVVKITSTAGEPATIKIGSPRKIAYISKDALSKTDDIIEQAESLGFHYENYVRSISTVESNGNTKASNAKAGYKLGISSSQHAHGECQLTAETLSDFGIITPEQIAMYRASPELQRSIMKKYTARHLKVALMDPVFILLMQQGVELNHLAAAMHHGGAGGTRSIAKKAARSTDPVGTFLQTLKERKDWLDTTTYGYVANTDEKYRELNGMKDSHLVEAQLPDVGEEVGNSESVITVAQYTPPLQTQVPRQSPTLGLGDKIPHITFGGNIRNANYVLPKGESSSFAQEKSREEYSTQTNDVDINEDSTSADSITIKTTGGSVTVSKELARQVEEEYRGVLLERIAGNAELMEKLGKHESDIRGYFEENIAYHESQGNEKTAGDIAKLLSELDGHTLLAARTAAFEAEFKNGIAAEFKNSPLFIDRMMAAPNIYMFLEEQAKYYQERGKARETQYFRTLMSKFNYKKLIAQGNSEKTST